MNTTSLFVAGLLLGVPLNGAKPLGVDISVRAEHLSVPRRAKEKYEETLNYFRNNVHRMERRLHFGMRPVRIERSCNSLRFPRS